jgi:hypothetical protein
MLQTKAAAAQVLKQYISQVQRQLGVKLKRIVSDRGGEFMAGTLQDFLTSEGILHTPTPTGTHAQNGKPERAHLTLLNDARTLLLAAGAPYSWWGYAVDYATYTRNHSLLPNQKRSPEDIWQGRRVRVDHIRPFGARCLVRVHKQTSKLHPRYVQARLIGYQHDTSNYRVLLSDSDAITFSRDVVFPEADSNSVGVWPAHPGGELPPTDGKLKLSLSLTPDSNSVGVSPSFPPTAAPPIPAAAPMHGEAREPVGADPVGADPVGASPAAVEALLPDLPEDDNIEEVPPASDEEPAQVRGWAYEPDPRFQRDSAPSPEPEHAPDAPRRSTRVTAGVAPERYASVATITSDTLVCLAARTQSLPTTYRQARDTPDWPMWELAIQAELDNMDKYGVWLPVPRASLPAGHRPLPTKWVFTRKLNGTTGAPDKYKARTVVRGDRQVRGRDYGELFAAVAHKDSIRVVLSLINYLDLKCDQVDIKGAFLNGTIDRELYVEPPEGSNIPATHTLKLRKSLYGLKQSPRLFSQALTTFLKPEGLQPSTADSCVYVRRRDGHFLLLVVHVDDQIIACNSRAVLDTFKARLNARFECSDSGPVGFFLGFNIHRDREERKLYMSQEHYLEALLERFNMSTSTPSKTPLPSDFKPIAATDEEFDQARHLDYPSLAGGILYAATVSRPDLAFAASVLCHYMSKWSYSHFRAAKHCLRYIRGTSDLCLVFDEAAAKRIVLGYADADWGGCQETRRSTTGYVFKTFGGTTGWKSKRQSTMALSTTQAEVLAVTDATRQAEWLRQFLDDLGMPVDGAIPILNDNRGAVLLSNHSHDHGTSKHFEIRTGYLRQETQNNRIKIEHVGTTDNIADGLTKSVPTARHLMLSEKLGMSSRPSPSSAAGTSSPGSSSISGRDGIS